MRHFHFSKTLTLSIVLIVCVLTAKSQHGSIRGSVKTNDGQPAAFVNLFLKENTNKGATTDIDGNFHIKNVKEGSYTLITSFVGFKTVEQSVQVTSGQTTTVSFVLSESAQELNEIVITDSRSLNERITSIGKADIRLMDLPQSVSIIDQRVLERQQSLTLGDVLMNTNGVYVMGTTGGFQEEIAGRGFAYSSSNTFKNGVRFNNAVMPEVNALERVEVMKGSNAILFGNVSAGGVLNLVTKKPKFDNGGEISFRTGSYDLYKPSFDLYGPIGNSNKVAYRVNTSYQTALSYRDDVASERIYFNPSLLYLVTPKTSILIEGDYLKDDRTLDFGVAAINYQIVDQPRGRYLNTSWAYYRAQQKSATLSVNHILNNNWSLKLTGSYQGFDNEQFGSARPNASSNMVKEDGTWYRTLQKSKTDQQYMIGQIDLTGKLKTGSVEHNILVGLDIDRYDNTTPAFGYLNAKGKTMNYDTINIFDLSERTQRHDIPDMTNTTLTENPINRQGYYVQDFVTLSTKLKVLAGVRYSKIESTTKVYDIIKNENRAPVTYEDDAFTPRLGVVYQPVKALSVFTSYSTSFILNNAIDSLGVALPASLLDQFEVGAKYELLKGLLSLNVVGYQIVNDNLAQPYLVTPKSISNAQEIAGEVKSKGFEVDIMSGSIAGFSFMAGYSYNDTRYTKSKYYEEDSKLRYNPSNTANASIYYTATNGLLKGANFGILGFYMGDRYAGRTPNIKNTTFKLIPLDDYVQLDLSAGYVVNNVSLRIKLSNILNELNYNAHDDNSINPIAPRMFSATIGYKW
jgi:iron complex outermembrane recepter protein